MLYYLDLDLDLDLDMVALNKDKCVCTAPAALLLVFDPTFLGFVCRRIIYHSGGEFFHFTFAL